MRAKVKPILSGLGIAGLLIGPFCRGEAPVQRSPVPIRIQLESEPHSLDPTKVTELSAFNLNSNIMLGLFRVDELGQLQKGLIEKYYVSKDGLRYRFSIRKNAFWSDGRPVSVSDFIFAFRRVLDPRTAAEDVTELLCIKGAHAVLSGKAKPETLGVSQSGAELVVQLEKAHPSFLEVLSMPATTPVRQDAATRTGGMWNPSWPTTGSFTIASYEPTKKLVLAPNPFNAPATAGEIQILFVPDLNTAANLFETGRLDILSSVQVHSLPVFEKLGLIQRARSSYVSYLSFNMHKPPFTDVDWRRAVSAAIDRKGLTSILNHTAEVATSYLPPGVEGHFDSEKLPAAFTKSLEKIKNIPDKPRIQVGYAATASNSLVMEKIQNDLKKTLNWDIVLEPTEWKTYRALVHADPQPMFLYGQGAPYGDPSNHFRMFYSAEEGTLRHYYKDEGYDKILRSIMTKPKGLERTRLIDEAQKKLLEEHAVVVPLLYRFGTFAVAKKITGFAVNPFGVMQLQKLSIRQGQ